MASIIKGELIREHVAGPLGGFERLEEFDRQEYDATAIVLALPLEEIHGLEDRRESTDDLIPEGLYQPLGGPRDGGYQVQLVAGVLDFFEVDGLEHIDQAMLDKARAEHGIAAADVADPAAQPAPGV